MNSLIVKIVCFQIFLILLNMFFVLSLNGDEKEYYFECKIKAGINKQSGIFGYFKEEIRFNAGTHYYRKSFFGISKKVHLSLELTLYYALKEIKRQKWKHLHMYWGEVNGKWNLIKIRVEANTKLEYHATLNFWRFREKVRLFVPVYKKIHIFAGDEVRYFFKENILGENEMLLGISLPIKKYCSMELYYDIRRFYTEGYLPDANYPFHPKFSHT